MDIWSTYKPYAKKIIDSGWTYDYLILGAKYKESDVRDGWINIGIIGNKEDYKIDYHDECVLRKKNTYWSLGGNNGQYDIGLYHIGMIDDTVNASNVYYWKNTDNDGLKKFG